MPRPAPVAFRMVNGSAWGALCQRGGEPCFALDAQRPINRNGRRLLAFRQFQVVQQHGQPSLVAGRQEPWQQRFGDQRIAHGDVACRGTQAGPQPGDRHQPHLAIEVRQFEREFGDPIRACLPGPHEQGDRLLRDVRQRETALVAALPQQRGRPSGGAISLPQSSRISRPSLRRPRKWSEGSGETNRVRRRIPSSTAARVTHAPGTAWTRTCRACAASASPRHRCQRELARGWIDPTQVSPMARRGATSCRSGAEQMHRDVGARTPIGVHRHIDISAAVGDRRSRSRCTRSLSTATSPRRQTAARYGLCRSPGGTELRSAETSTRSGTSGLSAYAQPERNTIEVAAMPSSSEPRGGSGRNRVSSRNATACPAQ